MCRARVKTPHEGSPLWQILSLYVPASLINLTDWMRPLLFNVFLSRNVKASVLSRDEAALELDAVGLAVMSLNLLMFATAYGFNGAVDAYAPVAFGAGDRVELAAVLVRQLLLLCLLGLLASVLFVHAEACFALIGLNAELAARTARLLSTMSLAVPGDFVYDAFGRWLRAQQLHRLVALCSLAALLVNVALNAYLAEPDQPTRGPLVALVAQNTLLPLLLALAYWRHRLAHAAPSSSSPLAAALAARARLSAEDVVGPALRRQLVTGLAAMLWTCAELWAWEAQVVTASSLATLT